MMNKEQMNKYAYELMTKNNPDEVVKNLLLKDKEIERLHNEIKTLLKENGNKEKVIIKQNNIIDELKDDSRVLKEFSAWIVNRHEPDLFYKMEIVNKLSKLKEGK